MDAIYYDNTNNKIWYNCTIFGDSKSERDLVQVFEKQIEFFPNGLVYLRAEDFINQQQNITEVDPDEPDPITPHPIEPTGMVIFNWCILIHSLKAEKGYQFNILAMKYKT